MGCNWNIFLNIYFYFYLLRDLKEQIYTETDYLFL